jgi:hypothetical protein
MTATAERYGNHRHRGPCGNKNGLCHLVQRQLLESGWHRGRRDSVPKFPGYAYWMVELTQKSTTVCFRFCQLLKRNRRECEHRCRAEIPGRSRLLLLSNISTSSKCSGDGDGPMAVPTPHDFIMNGTHRAAGAVMKYRPSVSCPWHEERKQRLIWNEEQLTRSFFLDMNTECS